MRIRRLLRRRNRAFHVGPNACRDRIGRGVVEHAPSNERLAPQLDGVARTPTKQSLPGPAAVFQSRDQRDRSNGMF